MQKSQRKNWHGWETHIDGSQGLAPLFSREMQKRVNKKLALNVAIVGEAGIGKSYLAIQIARVLDPKLKISQIVFTYKEYTEELLRGRRGKPIIFDEPSYAMGKREWYKEINQALTKTLESQRFLVRPLFIPIININLLDKTIRDYLLQFQVLVYDRGKARVYRISPSQHQDKTYYIRMCNLQYGLMDAECGIESCLTCKQIDTCDTLRSQYERKKRDMQRTRYQQDMDLATSLESKQLTIEQIFSEAYKLREHYMDDYKLDVKKMRIVLRDNGVIIGHTKAYEIKAMLEYRYPELFE